MTLSAQPVQALNADEILSRVRVVLCRTKTPANLGAAARALRCAGISQWTLVDPRCDPMDPEAERLAIHAEGMLQLAHIVPTLREALSGCALSIGASARARYERPPLTPQTAATRLVSAIGHQLSALRARVPVPEDGSAPRVRRASALHDGECVLVFGDERVGLTSAESEACDLLTSIPSAPEQPSWNLAQAIAIYSFEVRSAALALEAARLAEAGASISIGGRAHKEPRILHREERRLADAAQLAKLDRHFAQMLSYLRRERLQRRLMTSLERANLTDRESVLWTALVEQVLRRLRPPLA